MLLTRTETELAWKVVSRFELSSTYAACLPGPNLWCRVPSTLRMSTSFLVGGIDACHSSFSGQMNGCQYGPALLCSQWQTSASSSANDEATALSSPASHGIGCSKTGFNIQEVGVFHLGQHSGNGPSGSRSQGWDGHVPTLVFRQVQMERPKDALDA